MQLICAFCLPIYIGPRGTRTNRAQYRRLGPAGNKQTKATVSLTQPPLSPSSLFRRSPSERSGKGCCGKWFAGPPVRALIAVVALGGVACAISGAALGTTGLAGPPSSHLTAALLMIGKFIGGRTWVGGTYFTCSRTFKGVRIAGWQWMNSCFLSVEGGGEEGIRAILIVYYRCTRPPAPIQHPAVVESSALLRCMQMKSHPLLGQLGQVFGTKRGERGQFIGNWVPPSSLQLEIT